MCSEINLHRTMIANQDKILFARVSFSYTRYFFPDVWNLRHQTLNTYVVYLNVRLHLHVADEALSGLLALETEASSEVLLKLHTPLSLANNNRGQQHWR